MYLLHQQVRWSRLLIPSTPILTHHKNTRWHFRRFIRSSCSQDQLTFIFAALELKLQWQWNVGRNVADCFTTLLQPWTRSGFRKWVLLKNIKVVMSDDNPPGLGTKSLVEILSLILTLPSVQTKIRSQIVCRYKSSLLPNKYKMKDPYSRKIMISTLCEISTEFSSAFNWKAGSGNDFRYLMSQ